jgi:pantoate--beta-alanine ligase
METVKSVVAMQRLAARWKRAGTPVGLVPTMGYLHEGHLSLVEKARRVVGARGRVVLSIYVNPTQFAPQEDLARYPRDLPRDTRLCREAGVDVIFAPTNDQMYPAQSGQEFSTYVVEESLSKPMEGITRPTHFRGVATVVAKLFNIVLPEVAVFGAKDFQQAAVVRRMVRDLNFPVKLIVAPTRREADGLAMSSRNKYLSADERQQATALHQAIQEARARVRSTPAGIPAGRLKQALMGGLNRRPAARIDYLEFFDPATLLPVKTVRRGTQMALAVFLGRTRLIDNGALK